MYKRQSQFDYIDEDTAEITMTPDVNTVTEGQNIELTFQLTSIPTDDVTINVSNSNFTIPSPLTIIPANWNSNNNKLTITAKQDSDAENIDNIVVNATASSDDLDFNGKTDSVTVSIQDDDAEGIYLNPSGPLNLREGETKLSLIHISEPTRPY